MMHRNSNIKFKRQFWSRVFFYCRTVYLGSIAWKFWTVCMGCSQWGCTSILILLCSAMVRSTTTRGWEKDYLSVQNSG